MNRLITKNRLRNRNRNSDDKWMLGVSWESPTTLTPHGGGQWCE